ncbi:hypothetical protein COB72_01925 [bacterium]|nr:MAG: hypothetical protein COB72_01925 [bacterium]
MTTATIQLFTVSVTGKFAAMHWMHSATRIIDGATTVSFTAGVDEHTATDSAGGFADAAVGDQIEFTGSSNDAVNGFFRVKAKASDNQVTLEKRGFDAKTDGATVAAGDAIIVSQVPHDTKTVKGTVSLSNGATIKIDNTNFENENHEVWGHVSGTLSTPLTHGEVVTATVSQGSAWVCGNGDANAALVAVNVTNFSDLIDSSLELDYDNSYVCQNGVGDAPSDVGVAVDPATDPDIVEWWAPDLLVLADGADFAEVPGQINAATKLVPRKGAAWTWKFKAAGIGGNGCIETTDWGSNCWRQAITGAGRFVDAGANTVITITWRKDFSATNYRRLASNDTWPTIIKQHAVDTNTGAVVSVISVDAVGNGSAWTNYTKEELVAFTAGQVRVSNTNNYFESQTSRTYQIAGVVGVDFTEAKLKQYIRYCLEFANTKWSPEFYVSESGSDTNIGTQASPLLTAQTGVDRTYEGLGGHFVVPEGETVDLRISFGGQYKPCVAYSPMDWMGIRCDRSSSVAYPQFFNLGDGSGQQEMIKISAAGDGSYCEHWFNLGHDPREPRKIPTSSVHRKVGDAAFDAGYTQDGKMFTVLGDEGAPDETAFIAFFGWCNTVGGGISNINLGTRATQRQWYTEDYKCSSVHGHNAGLINPAYNNSSCVYITDQLAMPSPGWEPVDSVAAEATRSHGHYHDGSRVGVRIFEEQDLNDSSSHAAQARTGAYFNKCTFNGNPISVFVAAGQSVIEDCLFYDGRGILGSPRGWGFESQSSMDTFIRPLFLGGDYASGYSIQCNHSSDIYSQDPTAGPKEYGEGRHFGAAWRGIEIQNGLFYDRPNIAIELTGSENISIINCLFKAAGLPLKFNHTTGELTSANFTITGNNFEITDSTLAQVGGVAKTLAQTEALADTASGNTEGVMVFVDPTRTPDTYAQLYLDDPLADDLQLLNESCRQRGLGIYDPALSREYIAQWILEGFYSTSHPGKGPSQNPIITLLSPTNGQTEVGDASTPVMLFTEEMSVGNGTLVIELRKYSDDSVLDTALASDSLINALAKEQVNLPEIDMMGIVGKVYLYIPDGALVSLASGVRTKFGQSKDDWVWTVGVTATASRTTRSRQRGRSRSAMARR